MNFALREGWTLTHIINLEPGWQVNLRDDEHVVIATGDSIELALAEANRKVANHIYVGTRFSVRSLRNPADRPLTGTFLELLGLAEKPEPIKRRI